MNARIKIFCDKQSVFELIYKNINKDVYLILAEKCRKLIIDYNIIIYKVKSHDPNDSIIGNIIADILAMNSIPKDLRCCEQTVRLFETL